MQKETKVGIEVANPLTLTQGDYPVSSRCAQCNHIVPLSGRRRPKHESERCSSAGFKDAGGGPHAKACGWPLEAEKAKTTDSPPEPPGKNTALTSDQ